MITPREGRPQNNVMTTKGEVAEETRNRKTERRRSERQRIRMRTKRNEEPVKEEEGTQGRPQTNSRDRVNPRGKKQAEKQAKERESGKKGANIQTGKRNRIPTGVDRRNKL